MGIVVKLWNVSAATKKRSAGIQISDSIRYIFNPEKCSKRMDDNSKITIGRELMYITNDIKTLSGLYVGSRNITNTNNAMEEMIELKSYHGKMDGRIALHGMISLDDEDSREENAGKLMLLCDELMSEIFPDNQMVYAVHTNTEHLHVHFILNTVGLSGKKIHMDNEFMKNIFQPAINRLACKYGFHKNDEWERVPKKDIVPIAVRKIELRRLIDIAVEEAEDFETFVAYLRDEGVIVNVGKAITMQLEGMSMPMKSDSLGKYYSVAGIRDRIIHKRDEFTELRIGNYVEEFDNREVAYYVPSVIKKYAQMSDKEKQEAISYLKLGKNPWRMRSESNWQLRNISNELSMATHTYDIVKFYSNGTLVDSKLII